MNPAHRDRRPKNPSIHIAFWLTATLLLLNVLWLPTMIGLDGVVTGFVALLLLCSQLFLASLAFRLPLRRAIGDAGLLILAALTSYLVIGSLMAIGVATYPFEDMLKIGYSIMAVAAAGVGGSLVLRQGGIDRLAVGMLMLLGVTCIFILASPVLEETVFSLQHQDFGQQAFGVFTDPNDAGFMCCLAAVLAIASLAPHSQHRTLAAAVLVLSVTATILTNSRTALVTLVLILLFFLPSLYRAFRAFAIARLAIAGIAGSIILVTVFTDLVSSQPEHQIRRMEELTQLFEADVLEISRLYLWRLALPQIAEAPILGNGLGAMRNIYGTSCGGTVDDFCGVHNTYLMLLGEAGIVPLMLFLLFIASLLRRCLRRRSAIAADVAAGWTLVLAANAVTFHHLLSSLWCGFVIGLICAMAAYAVETAADRTQPRAPGETGLSVS